MFDRANLGDNLMKFGMGTATLGISYAMMKDSMRGCGCNSIFGGGMGMPMMGMGMPMNTGLFNMPMMGMGGMGMGMGMNPMLSMGGYNPMMMGGMNPMQNLFNPFGTYNNNKQQTLQKMNNAKADAVSSDEDISFGKELEKATKEMVDKDGKLIKGKGFRFVSDEWLQLSAKSGRTSEENEELEEEYNESVEYLARSYLAHIDKNGGDRKGDGYITMDEFADYTVANDAPEGIKQGSAEEAKFIKTAGIAFNKLDLNKDGTVDWKEMAAMIHASDTEQVTGRGHLGKQNGVISAEDLDALNSQLINEKDTAADAKLQKSYKSLFGNNQ